MNPFVCFLHYGGGGWMEVQLHHGSSWLKCRSICIEKDENEYSLPLNWENRCCVLDVMCKFFKSRSVFKNTWAIENMKADWNGPLSPGVGPSHSQSQSLPGPSATVLFCSRTGFYETTAVALLWFSLILRSPPQSYCFLRAAGNCWRSVSAEIRTSPPLTGPTVFNGYSHILLSSRWLIH